MVALNNREIAGLIWLCLVLCLFLYKPDIRKNVVGLIRSAMAPAIVKFMTLTLLYVIGLLMLIVHTNYWSPTELIKPATLWFVLVAIPTLSLALTQDHTTLRERCVSWLKNNLRFLIFLEFLVGLRTFSLLSELILLPVVTFLVLLSTVADLDKRNQSAKTLFDWCLTFIGAYMIYQATSYAFSNIDDVATLNNAKSFYFGPIMSLLLIPFSYLAHVSVKYDSVFHRIDRKCPQTLTRKTKLYSLMMFKADTRLASSWATSLFRQNMETFDQIRTSIKTYKSLPKRFLNPKTQEKERWSPYSILPCLNDYGLTAFLYEPYYENEWGGKTRTKELGASTFCNKVNFRVDGSEYSADRLRLAYNAMYDREDVDEQLNLILDMVETIVSHAIDEPLPKEIIDGILNIQEVTYHGAWFDIEVTIRGYQNQNAGFELDVRFIRRKDSVEKEQL